MYDHPLSLQLTVAQQIAEAAALRKLFRPPNTVGTYTDLNYVLLDLVIERVTGHDVGYFVTTGIIERLGLAGTSYPVTNALPGGLHGYGSDRATQRFVDKTLFNPELAGAAGAMISSLNGLHRFARAICKGGLLQPQTQRALLVSRPLAGTNVRYGEGILNTDGICGHSGTINGFNTDMYYIALRDATIVINVNRLDKDNQPQTGPFLETLVRRVMQLPTGASASPAR